MLDVCDGLEPTECDLPEPVDHSLSSMKLSACDFYDTTEHSTMQTMKVVGILHTFLVNILLDSGNTHNFVDSMLLKRLRWPCHNTKPFDLMIANGGRV